MKVLIHTTYGGFRIPESACKEICDTFGENDGQSIIWETEYYRNIVERSSVYALILYESYKKDFEANHIKSVEVPENATDVRIFDYDGAEALWCVVDGKMVRVD